ncbi:hypothetical protein D3C78_1684060 [compost metagenome]
MVMVVLLISLRILKVRMLLFQVEILSLIGDVLSMFLSIVMHPIHMMISILLQEV